MNTSPLSCWHMTIACASTHLPVTTAQNTFRVVIRRRQKYHSLSMSSFRSALACLPFPPIPYFLSQPLLAPAPVHLHISKKRTALEALEASWREEAALHALTLSPGLGMPLDMQA